MKLSVPGLIVFLAAASVSLSSYAVTEQELVEKARSEGILQVDSNQLAYSGVVIDAFQKKYPFVKITHKTFAPVQGREYFFHVFESELDSERTDVVFRCQDRDLLEWKDNGWMADLSDLPNWSQRPKHLEDDPRYVYFLGAPHVIFYNAKLTKESELPKSYDELLEPKWKGKIAMRSPLQGNAGAFFTNFIETTHGLDWFKRLAAQKPYVAQNYMPPMDLVAKGKYKIGIGRDLDIITYKMYSKQKGKNLDEVMKYKIVDEESPYQYQLATVNVKAPHPATSRLFMNFLLSPEAVAALEKEGFSVGERQAAQMKHQKLWQWELQKHTMSEYVSGLARAYRFLKQNGANVEKEGPITAAK